ncbi:class I SAM-dependent methyltransferase [Pleomorphomonas oryzae]|uniref:class I SAM-dependent methyltransferase n=1 Tax=Pleomorphomonas oryzae TaxID=261934 RepID=UPI00146A4061|nr:class I SAM-dependent methyltransferase [Pleomorphomonas oryzae]
MPELHINVVVEETTYEKPTAWRLLGSKGKAGHVIALCDRNGIKPESLLEVGAGDGAILRSLSDKHFCDNMHAVEISKSGVEVILEQNISGLRSCQVFDGYSLPFQDNAFDLVVLSHVLEHVEHERALLREILRVSKFQVIEIPMDCNVLHDEVYHALGPSYGHINARSPDSLRFLLTTENMVVIDDDLGKYELDLQEYDYFVNNSRERSEAAVGEFRRRYHEDEKRFNSLQGNDKVKAANYYAVLTRAETTEERTKRAVSAAKKAIASGRVQASRLIFDHFISQEKIDDCALEIAAEFAEARPDIALEYLERISPARANSEDVVRVRGLAASANRATAVTLHAKPAKGLRAKIGRVLTFLARVSRASRK